MKKSKSIYCVCGDSDCKCKFAVDDNMLLITSKNTAFNTKLKIKDNKLLFFIKDWLWRFKAITNIIINGYIEGRLELIIKDKKQIDSIINLLVCLRNKIS